MPETLRGKYQYYTQADLTKLRGYCNNIEITPLKDAVADYVRHYLVPDKRLGDEVNEPAANPAPGAETAVGAGAGGAPFASGNP